LIRKKTGKVLSSGNLPAASLGTLKIILQQDELHGVTELDLFLACARWARKKEKPREELGTALGLVKFRTLTIEEFARHVCTTGLLTGDEQSLIYTWFVTNESDMPEGFNTDASSRCLKVIESDEVNDDEYDQPERPCLSSVECSKCKMEHFLEWKSITVNRSSLSYAVLKRSEETSPIVFSLSADSYILGVTFVCFPENGIIGKECNENAKVEMKLADGKIVASSTIQILECEELLYTVCFKNPCLVSANEEYSIHASLSQSDSKYYVCKSEMRTLSINSNIKVRFPKTVYNPIRYIHIAEKRR
jgi:hypothetical protein